MPNTGEKWKHQQTGDLVEVGKINGDYVFVRTVSAEHAWWVSVRLFLMGTFTLA